MAAARRPMSLVVRLAQPSIDLDQAVTAFLTNRDLASTTRRVYELTLKALAKDLGGHVEVATITHADLSSFLHRRHREAAAKTWNRVVATFGSFFAYCGRRDWVRCRRRLAWNGTKSEPTARRSAVPGPSPSRSSRRSSAPLATRCVSGCCGGCSTRLRPGPRRSFSSTSRTWTWPTSELW